jgi:hypothetical protein
LISTSSYGDMFFSHFICCSCCFLFCSCDELVPLYC